MNKKDKTNKCREILYKYPVGVEISNPDDFEFLLYIFEGHTEWDKKVGVGIDSISVGLTKYNGKCFFINRKDGSSTDISFVHSIKNRSDIYKIKVACRSSIRDIIVDYRVKNVVFGKTTCPITNDILTKENTHIDHYNLTFNDLFNRWVSGWDMPFLVKHLNETIDNNMETYFTDEKISLDFVNFHNQNTHLRAVSKRANLSILKRRAEVV